VKKLMLIAFAALTLLSFTACSSNKNEAVTLTTKVASAEVANPTQAVSEINNSLEIKIKDLKYAEREELLTQFKISPEDVADFTISYAEGKYGISNVFLIKPVSEDKTETIKDALRAVQEQYIQKTEKFDVYNSYEIAQNSEVYVQGQYVVMLMLEDNDAAKNIIDKYIPVS